MSNNRVQAGDAFCLLELTAITGEPVIIPDPSGSFTHLQFRRFAGCPICNLHLRSVAQRVEEIRAAGVREVVLFHSTTEELLRYQDELPFLVVADPRKELYRRFGVESGRRALTDRRAWRAIVAGLAARCRTVLTERRRRPLPHHPNGGNLGLPADMLITPTGRAAAVKYGEHADDQWTVDELLAHAAVAQV